MDNWIAENLNHVVSWFLGVVTALVAVGWKTRGYVVRIEKTEGSIGRIENAIQDLCTDKDKDSDRIRALEDSQIRTAQALDQIPQLVESSRVTSNMLSALVGRLDSRKFSDD